MTDYLADNSLHDLAAKVVDRFALKTIRDLIQTLPRSMCHVLQEPKIFGTYQPKMVRMLFPQSEWETKDANYRRIRDEVIPSISLQDYLENLLDSAPTRLPCFCGQMADAAALVAAQMFHQEIYVIRNIYVNYLWLPERWHCINAMLLNGKIAYFDVSAYAQVIDPASGRILKPHKLPGFDAADIALTFLESPGWLQSEPFPRLLQESDGRLHDNFNPSPLSDRPADAFFSVVHPRSALVSVGHEEELS